MGTKRPTRLRLAPKAFAVHNTVSVSDPSPACQGLFSQPGLPDPEHPDPASAPVPPALTPEVTIEVVAALNPPPDPQLAQEFITMPGPVRIAHDLDRDGAAAAGIDGQEIREPEQVMPSMAAGLVVFHHPNLTPFGAQPRGRTSRQVHEVGGMVRESASRSSRRCC